MPEITEAQLADFCEKLKDFRESLTGPQQALLDAIVGIAWNASVKEEYFQEEFEGCFTPDQAELLLAYSPGGPVADGWAAMLPRIITPGQTGIKGPHAIG
jgi:hypothetical protein